MRWNLLAFVFVALFCAPAFAQPSSITLSANPAPIVDAEINGRPVTRTRLSDWTEPNKRPDGSAHKFDVAYKDHPRQGYIGLQDHGSPCWFKNIKLKPLPR